MSVCPSTRHFVPISSESVDLAVNGYTSIARELTCDRSASYPRGAGSPVLSSACAMETGYKHRPYSA